MTERLEEIKTRFNAMKELESFKKLAPTDLFFDDYDWLIQQAERAQELEETNKKNYWIAADFKFENLQLEQQNKRYREAIIEALHGLKTLPSVAPRLYLISILDKALEGDK